MGDQLPRNKDGSPGSPKRVQGSGYEAVLRFTLQRQGACGTPHPGGAPPNQISRDTDVSGDEELSAVRDLTLQADFFADFAEDPMA